MPNRRTFSSLPPELLTQILSYLPSSALRPATLALIKALGPHQASGISRVGLWKYLKVSREGQAWQIQRRLLGIGRRGGGSAEGDAVAKDEREREKAWVKELCVEVWRDDPQLIVNLLLLLPALTSVSLTVGPLFAPENMEELLEKPAWSRTVEEVNIRFNTFVEEKSYWGFLKGAYFDTTVEALASWPVSSAPHLRRIAFIQDLPPNHGRVMKATPAFGLRDVEETLDEIAVNNDAAGKKKSAIEAGKMDFAQPIVFFRLHCITTLSLSPLSAQITSITLRLPRRSLIPPLTSSPDSFPALTHLDISTTHFPPSTTPTMVPLFVRLYPKLRHLVLDRCSGLISEREWVDDEDSAGNLIRWLGRCFGGQGASRAEEGKRGWRRIVKDRADRAAAAEMGNGGGGGGSAASAMERRRKAGRNGFGSMPAMRMASPAAVSSSTAIIPPQFNTIKTLLVLPPLPSLQSLSLGLHDSHLVPKTSDKWRKLFEEGFRESFDKAVEITKDVVESSRNWREVEKGERRIVAFRSELEKFGLALPPPDAVEEDTEFLAFLAANSLVTLTQNLATSLLSSLLLHSSSSEAGPPVVCFEPNCSGKAGVPHLSLQKSSKESLEERETKEKRIWEEEEREKREGWGKRPHEDGCGAIKDWRET